MRRVRQSAAGPRNHASPVTIPTLLDGFVKDAFLEITKRARRSGFLLHRGQEPAIELWILCFDAPGKRAPVKFCPAMPDSDEHGDGDAEKRNDGQGER
jgi:hypothetical protein